MEIGYLFDKCKKGFRINTMLRFCCPLFFHLISFLKQIICKTNNFFLFYFISNWKVHESVTHFHDTVLWRLRMLHFYMFFVTFVVMFQDSFFPFRNKYNWVKWTENRKQIIKLQQKNLEKTWKGKDTLLARKVNKSVIFLI